MPETELPKLKLGQNHQGATVIGSSAVLHDRHDHERCLQYVIYIEGDPGYYVLKCHKNYGAGLGYSSIRVKESLSLTTVVEATKSLVSRETLGFRDGRFLTDWPTQETFDAVD